MQKRWIMISKCHGLINGHVPAVVPVNVHKPATEIWPKILVLNIRLWWRIMRNSSAPCTDGDDVKCCHGQLWSCQNECHLAQTINYKWYLHCWILGHGRGLGLIPCPSHIQFCPCPFQIGQTLFLCHILGPLCPCHNLLGPLALAFLCHLAHPCYPLNLVHPCHP